MKEILKGGEKKETEERENYHPEQFEGMIKNSLVHSLL
jgi:hypothetical protein